jgi:putative phosphoesterase
MIAIISDTHMPRGERRLTEACTAVIARSDLIIHAGDFTERSVLEQLESYAPVVAVHGNVDEPALRRLLPETTTVDVGATRIAVVHDGGPARGRLERLRHRFPQADAVIFGHSHLPLQERAGDGFQIFNPGSPTERRRAPSRTIGIARCEDTGLRFELVVVG